MNEHLDAVLCLALVLCFSSTGPLVCLIILGCIAVILIVLVIVGYYVYKKRRQLKPTSQS